LNITIKCINCKKGFDIIDFADENESYICPFCGKENEMMVNEPPPPINDNPSKAVIIYDFVLAGISFLDGIFKVIRAIYTGREVYWFFTYDGIWYFFPFIIGFGLLQHKKIWRIVGTIVLIISLLLTYFVFKTVTAY
jgi:DNA-directed RNA polymerase subunit RPC12/RpoP